MFDTMIKPIVTYSSDVWGINKNALHELDRVFLNHVRCVLCVKLTTSNVIVIGESGKFPPSLYCHINVLCFFHRLLKMQPRTTLYNLNNQAGISTWISKAYELSWSYDIDMDSCTQLIPGQFNLNIYAKNAWSVILFPHGWATSAAVMHLSLEHIYIPVI